MNFFEHQEQARKRTGLLVGLLVAAVVCLIAITVLAVGVFLYYLQSHATSVSAYQAQRTSLGDHFVQLLQSPITGWIALGVVTVVTLGCLYKLMQLGRGGRVVAEALGGRLLDPSSRDATERKVLNIVEEMAIASGNPVPPVYMMDDESINAFAAGMDRRSAVIGITRGCAEILNRDELQGVVAHEFSHIHNGDMRLNMRLIAILHGILLIGLIGFYIMHGSGRSYRGRRDGKQVSLGLALMAIGYGGTFFGNVIKAAVSRQREFLADASAVQFTRNPLGISGALQKIGGYSRGSKLQHSHAAEFSHFFFSQGISTAFSSLMATHPPLAERIKRVNPRWQGKFPAVSDTPIEDSTSTSADSPVSHFAQGAGASVAMDDSVVEHIGEARPNSITQADAILASLPSALYEATHSGFSARAVVYGLLLDADEHNRQAQLDALRRQAHPVTYKVLLSLAQSIQRLTREARLPLLSLCMPALKQLSEPQYQVFKQNMLSLIKADNKVSLFEWSLYRIATKNIEAKDVVGVKSLKHLTDELELLLYFVARAGESADVIAAVNCGREVLKLAQKNALPEQQMSLPNLDKALNQLEALKPLEKPLLLKALIAVIKADNQITACEKELFRAIADTLNCPVPPLD